jgi:hypothetical protein
MARSRAARRNRCGWAGRRPDRAGRGDAAPLAGAIARGAAHVAHHQTREQREAAQRHRDEGQHARHDLAAGPRRLPGKPRDRAALRVGERGDAVVAGRGRLVDLAQIVQLQRVADLASMPSSIYFTENTIGARRCRGRDRRRSRLPPPATMAGLPAKSSIRAVLRPGLSGSCAARTGRLWAGMALSRPRKRSSRGKFRGKSIGADRAGAGGAYLMLVVGIDDHDDIVVEEGLEPPADPRSTHCGSYVSRMSAWPAAPRRRSRLRADCARPDRRSPARSVAARG